MMHSQGSWRKGMVILTLCAAGVLAGAAFRNPARGENAMRPMAQSSIAVVNLVTLLEGLKEYKEGRALMEAKQKEMQPRLDEIKSQQKRAQEELDMLKDPPLAKKIEIRGRIIELQALGEARQAVLIRMLDMQMGELLRRVFLKATETAKRLATQDGWDVIIVDDRHIEPPEFVKNPDGKDSHGITFSEVQRVMMDRHVLVASDRVDVTTALINMMNNEFETKKK